MKISYIFLLILLSISKALYSQNNNKPIDYRFADGERNFVSFFSKNISLSEQAIENAVLDNSITKITLDPNGEISRITTINPIDSIIDNEVLRVIDLSRKLWRKRDKITYDQVFYIQIAFSTPKYQPNLLKPKSLDIMKLFPEPILIILERSLKNPLQKSEDIAEKANKALADNKLEEALRLINELIKREPFNRDLYKSRIMINVKLNRPVQVDEDNNKIFNFAEGYTLDELYKSQEY